MGHELCIRVSKSLSEKREIEDKVVVIVVVVVVAVVVVAVVVVVVAVALVVKVVVVEMDVIKFKDNTMVCGCTTEITSIYGVIKLNYRIRLEYCKDCVCDLLQILNLWMWPG